MMPTLFLSHGAPTLPLSASPAREFLKTLGAALPKPKAIVVASAHWDTDRPLVSAMASNPTIHDFFGFPPALYQMTYPAPGSARIAEEVSDLLCAAGLPSQIDPERGLDHGAWVPLMLMYPAADIPVMQLSIQSRLGPAHHLQLGKALRTLREAGVLVIGSGSLTHNLSEFRGHGVDDPAPAWVNEFADWFGQALAEGRTSDLLTYRRQAPFAARNHPSEEHLLPLYVALGAGGEGAVTRLHASSTYAILRMDVFQFGDGRPQ